MKNFFNIFSAVAHSFKQNNELEKSNKTNKTNKTNNNVLQPLLENTGTKISNEPKKSIYKYFKKRKLANKTARLSRRKNRIHEKFS